MKSRLFLVLLPILVGDLTGCKSNSKPDCSSDLECKSNQACINEVCIDLDNPVCTLDKDCGEGKKCQAGKCILDNPPACSTQKECGPNRSCIEGLCQEDETAGTVLVEAPSFGSEDGQFQVDFGEEGEPVCPNSFAIDEKNDRLYVLDQLNQQVQVFIDGVFVRSIPTPVGSYLRDVALWTDGSILVLDKDQRNKVLWLDSNGEIQKELAIVGKHIDDAGLVERMVVRPDGLWLSIFGEGEYEVQVHVADADGNAIDSRELVDGILSVDGGKLMRAIIDEASGSQIQLAVQSRTNGAIVSTTVGCDGECDFSELASDSIGNSYIVVYDSQPDTSESGRQRLVVVDASGKIIHQANLRIQSAPVYPFRSVRIEPSGNVYQLEITEQGATVRRYSR